MNPKLSRPVTSKMMNQVLSFSPAVLMTAPTQAMKWVIAAVIITRTATPASPAMTQPNAFSRIPVTSGPSLTRPPLARASPPAAASRISAPANAIRLS